MVARILPHMEKSRLDTIPVFKVKDGKYLRGIVNNNKAVPSRSDVNQSKY